jgi:hypothetical protein
MTPGEYGQEDIIGFDIARAPSQVRSAGRTGRSKPSDLLGLPPRYKCNRKLPGCGRSDAAGPPPVTVQIGSELGALTRSLAHCSSVALKAA